MLLFGPSGLQKKMFHYPSLRNYLCFNHFFTTKGKSSWLALLLKGNPDASSTPPCSSHPGSSPGLIGASGIMPWTSPPSSAPLHVPHTFIDRTPGFPVCRYSPKHLLSPSKTGEILVSAKKINLSSVLKGSDKFGIR